MSTGIALVISRTFGTRWGGGSAPRHGRLYPRERPSIHFTGGWVDPGPVWTGGKSRPHRDSIPDRPAHSSVAIPTELPGPSTNISTNKLICHVFTCNTFLRAVIYSSEYTISYNGGWGEGGGGGRRTIVRVKWIKTQYEVKFLLEVTKICSRTPCHIWALKFITVSKTAHHPQAYYWSLSTAESSDHKVEMIADRLKAGRLCFLA